MIAASAVIIIILATAAALELMPPGAEMKETDIGNGITIMQISAKGGGSEDMNALSEFDRRYLCCGHGGNPVEWALPPPADLVLSLWPGDNKLDGLLPCSGVDQIKTIEVVSDTKDLLFVLTKHSQFKGQPPKRCETSNLMDCRTMFVPYKDTYTSLTIHAPERCRLIFNRASQA